MQNWTRTVIPIETVHCTPASLEKARRVSDLVAWAGAGQLEPRRIQELIAPDAGAPICRGLALLVREPGGRHFLVTACHLLRTPLQQPDIFVQDLLAPDRFWTATYEGPDGEDGTAVELSETEVKFVTGPRHDVDQLGWLPTTALPHLDLAVVHIDAHQGILCAELKEAGYEFACSDLLADSPSREGANVFAVELEGGGAAGNAVRAYDGKITTLRESLSFFWTDVPASSVSSGGPVIEADRIVGILTPQAGLAASNASPWSNSLSPLATVTKAAHVKALFRAHDRAGC